MVKPVASYNMGQTERQQLALFGVGVTRLKSCGVSAPTSRGTIAKISSPPMSRTTINTGRSCKQPLGRARTCTRLRLPQGHTSAPRCSHKRLPFGDPHHGSPAVGKWIGGLPNMPNAMKWCPLPLGYRDRDTS